jgi:hypothetical protein
MKTSRFCRRAVPLLVAFVLLSPDDGTAADDRRNATPRPGAPAIPRKKTRAEMDAEEEPLPEPTPPNGAQNQPEVNYVTEPVHGTWVADARRLAITVDGQYTLAGPEQDAGSVSAQLGRMRRRSARTGKWVFGTYKLRGIDLLETDGAFGKCEWRRVK